MPLAIRKNSGSLLHASENLNKFKLVSPSFFVSVVMFNTQSIALCGVSHADGIHIHTQRTLYAINNKKCCCDSGARQKNRRRARAQGKLNLPRSDKSDAASARAQVREATTGLARRGNQMNRVCVSRRAQFAAAIIR